MKLFLLAAVCSIALAGCGLSGLPGITKPILKHKSALVHHHKRVHVLSAALCGFHAYRAYRDAHHGKVAFTAFQAWRTVHNCRRVIR